MRPLCLELEGFTAFREHTEIDFDGVDLFALTGPTGSGKSSIIDAMVFALYGSVPRHGKRDVAPIVSTGRLETKVRLDFEVAGRLYTAVRVVRRTPRGGANTGEARLESGDEVLAGNAAEVTERVTELLGLTFDQFTKSVVLPQGEFARFLHDKPAARQDLLVSLLDLGVYEEVARAARVRQQLAEGKAAEVRSRLEDLAAVDEEVVARATARVEELEKLLAAVEAAVPGLEELEEQGRQAAARVAELETRHRALRSLTAPADLDELGPKLDETRVQVADAGARLEESEQRMEAAEGRLAALPSRSDLEVWAMAATERGQAIGRRKDLEDELSVAEETVAVAVAAEAEAEAELIRRRDADLAAHLRRGLTPGDECPVCGQVVTEVPPVGNAAGLEEAERAVDEARATRRVAEERRAAISAKLTEVVDQVERLDAVLAEAPAAEEVEARLVQVGEAEKELEAAKKDREAARQAHAVATRGLEALEEDAKRLATQLMKARDVVAALDPPAIDPADPTEGWRRLLSWRDQVAPELGERLAAVTSEVEELRRRYRTAEEELRQRCRSAGVEPGDRLRDAVVSDLAAAQVKREGLVADLRRKEGLASELERLETEAEVAKTLARHLSASGFEKWLLDEALRVLADGANRRLAELADGRYSLAVSSNLAFEVIDHQAADERRTVRSLSGGETFLVSLALALSLADQISSLAASGTSRLDSIFLDEGFGTLDAETLETVASVISDIGADGKMVGLVTHVRDLADQLPVRFEVRSGPVTATVERVEG